MSMNSNQKKIAATVVNFFKSNGYTTAQACGIAGNMYVECEFSANAINPNDKGKESIGLCQWRGERNQNLKNYASQKGKHWGDLSVQLAFALYEMNTTEKKTPTVVKATSTPEQSALAFAQTFERCSAAYYLKRQSAAREIYNGITQNKWEAGDMDYGSEENTEEEKKEDVYETIDNENTNLINAPGREYDNESNIPSDSNGDFKQLTGYGINWENDDSLIVYESEPESSESQSGFSPMKQTGKGKKPPTLSQKFSPSISVSEHSFNATSLDPSEKQNLPKESSGESPESQYSQDTFAV